MSADEKPQRGITRGDLLKGAAVAAPGLLVGGRARLRRRSRPRGEAAPRREIAGMNVIVFITDQQRAIQHFPPGWAKRNMPGLTRLQQHGLTFDRTRSPTPACARRRARR